MEERIKLDNKKIISMYKDDMLSSRKIGSIVGVSGETILERLKSAGVYIRGRRSAPIVDEDVANNTYRNKAWLMEQYVDRGKSARQIGRESGVCHKTIFKNIDGHNIDREQHNRAEDLSGQRFGKLVVLHMKEKRSKFGAVVFLCKCDCGNITSVLAGSLKSGKTRSCGCLIKDILAMRCGTNSPVWNSDLTDEEREDRRDYKEYKEWRVAVYERDDYTCQKCGETGGTLNAHHVESYAVNKELRTVLGNGITLCQNCHDKFHHIYGYNNTRKQLNEFMLMED